MKAIGQRTVCREDWYGAGMDGGLNNYCPAQSESTGSRSGGGVRTLGWIVAHSTSSIENKVKVGRATSREASAYAEGGGGHRWTYEGRAARAASPQITRGGRGGEKGVGVQASVRTAMTTGAMGESTEEGRVRKPRPLGTNKGLCQQGKQARDGGRAFRVKEGKEAHGTN